MLIKDPALNTTKWNGSVWANLRQERLTCMLYHLRRLARDQDGLKQAAIKLSGSEYAQLKDLIGMIDLRDFGIEKCNLAKGASTVLEKENLCEETQPQSPGQTTVAYNDDELPPPKRRLKAQVSEVSVDSTGFPNMLQSPEKSKNIEKPKPELGTKSFLLRRVGSRVGGSSGSTSTVGFSEQGDASLKEALGFF